MELAESGARQVVGLDLNRELIKFAVENVRTHFSHLAGKVRFECCDLAEWSRDAVDYFVSRSTFEHIIDLASVLAEMRLRLKPGGRIYTGFEPLWPSPFGGHGRIHKHLPLPGLPWGHLLVTEKYILQQVNRTREQPVHSIVELGLNKLSVHDYRRIFRESGLRVLTFRVNCPAGRMRGKILTLLGKVPFLTKYMAYNVHAVLEKRPPEQDHL